ncbi:MAG: hypothetical protein SFW36_05205, partial [Leptolyngbyaceae cyanobacterium bins.59]|nr:hypothetical protein [Leptolyngbyaceae cyanobacterium bins.59]
MQSKLGIFEPCKAHQNCPFSPDSNRSDLGISDLGISNLDTFGSFSGCCGFSACHPDHCSVRELAPSFSGSSFVYEALFINVFIKSVVYKEWRSLVLGRRDFPKLQRI